MRRHAEPCRTFLAYCYTYAHAPARGIWATGIRFGTFGRFGTRIMPSVLNGWIETAYAHVEGLANVRQCSATDYLRERRRIMWNWTERFERLVRCFESVLGRLDAFIVFLLILFTAFCIQRVINL